MTAHRSALATIRDFLAQKRIAFAGLSREPAGFSGRLFDEFCRRGYDMVPVNPNASELRGRRCFARIRDIEPPVDAVLVMTPASATGEIVRDCEAAGVRRVWMYRGVGKGAVSPKAVAFCRERGIQAVPGNCPFMFLPDTAGFHRFHGFLLKLFGRYPA